MNRIVAFDVYRALAIIGVVAAHLLGRNFREGAEQVLAYDIQQQGNFWFAIFYRQIFLFPVPLFLFCTGYFNAKLKIPQTGRDFYQYYQKRLPRILIPYLVWSCVLFGLQAAVGHKLSLSGVCFKLLTGTAFIPYYYCILIVQYYLLTPLLIRFAKSPLFLSACAAITAASMAANYYLTLHLEIKIPAYLQMLSFTSWLFFFGYGLFLGSRPDLEKKIAKYFQLLVFCAIAGLLLSWLESIHLFSYSQYYHPKSPIKFSSFFYSFALISLLLGLKDTITSAPKWLLRVGEFSYGIYLTHVFLTAAIAVAFNRIGVDNNYEPLLQPVLTAFVVAACVLFALIGRRVLGTERSSRFLGL